MGENERRNALIILTCRVIFQAECSFLWDSFKPGKSHGKPSRDIHFPKATSLAYTKEST